MAAHHTLATTRFSAHTVFSVKGTVAHVAQPSPDQPTTHSQPPGSLHTQFSVLKGLWHNPHLTSPPHTQPPGSLYHTVFSVKGTVSQDWQPLLFCSKHSIPGLIIIRPNPFRKIFLFREDIRLESIKPSLKRNFSLG